MADFGAGIEVSRHRYRGLLNLENNAPAYKG